MTDYTSSASGPFNTDIALVDTTDLVKGGLDGESNVATKQLANNTAYLYDLAKGYEDIVVIDNDSVVTVDITVEDISRKLVELELVDDAFLTANMPQASTYKLGGIAVIKRKSAITNKKITLEAHASGDVFYVDNTTFTELDLNGEDVLVMYCVAGGWKVMHYPGVYWQTPVYPGDFIEDPTNPIRYRKYGYNNYVTMKGISNNSSGTSLGTDTVMFILPEGYRPTEEQEFITSCPTNTPPVTVIRVRANGEVSIAGDLITTSNIGVYMNIGFYAEQ